MNTEINSTETPKNWKKTFFIVWIGQAFSLLGSSLVSFALVWWMTKTTGSAVILTTATLVALIPEAFLSPFAGAIVDRMNRKKVMILADAGIALATLFLGILFWLNVVQVWHVFILLFIRSLGGIFHWPAMNASTSLMVPDKELARISGLNQTIRGALNIFGPPLGALCLEIMPLFGVLFIDIGTAAIAVVTLLFVTIPQPKMMQIAQSITPRQLVKDVGEGFRYLYKWSGLFALLIGASFINFFLIPTDSLMPLLVTEHFHGQAWHLSLLQALFGIGAVVGGLILTTWGGFKRRIWTSFMGIIGISIGTLVMALATEQWFIIAVIGGAIVGISLPLANGPLSAIVQSKVAPEMQGRVFSTMSSMATFLMVPAMLIAGPIADSLGVRSCYFIGAAGCFLIVAILGLMPAVRNIEENHISMQESAELVEDVTA